MTERARGGAAAVEGINFVQVGEAKASEAPRALLSGDFKLTDADIRQIMAEADENEDGLIEFGEFIPLALEVMEALYAKSEGD